MPLSKAPVQQPVSSFKGLFDTIWIRWLDLLVKQVNNPVVDSLRLPSYTVTTVPSASNAGMIIYISNESGGAVLAFSDGTNWRRCTDRAIVS